VIATLRAYLWKESRDGRALLVGIPAAMTVAIALAGIFMPARAIRDPFFPQIAAVGTFVLGLLAIASELIPGETRRGKMSFLLRQPAGLGTAYLAKVIYLLTALILLTAFSYVIASVVAFTRGAVIALPTGDLASDLWRLAWNPSPGLLLAAVAGVAGWTFLVSSWLPRGSLSVPAAALALGIFGVPLYLLYTGVPGIGPNTPLTPCITFRTILLFALGPAPFAIAWISFVRGRRFSRGPWSGAWRGLIAMLVLAMPAWAFGAYEVKDWVSLDPASPRLRIEDVRVGKDGRFAFVNVRMERRFQEAPTDVRRVPTLGPRFPLVVDLETGAWRRAGDAEDRFVGWWRHSDSSVIMMHDASADDGEHCWYHYLDGTTGELIKTGWGHLAHEKLEAYRSKPRARALPEGYRLGGRRGLGFFARRDGEWFYFDPFRQRIYPYDDFSRGDHVVIRPGRWLVKRWVRPEGGPRHEYRFALLDPDTGERTEIQGMTRSPVLLDDGRLLTPRSAEPGEALRLFVFDPESGRGHDLGVSAVHVYSLGKTPRGAHILLVLSDGEDGYRHSRIARLRPETLELTWFEVPAGLLGSGSRRLSIIGEDTLIAVSQWRRLVRVRLGDTEPEVIFPREEAR
jgi:hypothetical protein